MRKSTKQRVFEKMQKLCPDGFFRHDKVSIDGYGDDKWCIVFFDVGITNEINFNDLPYSNDMLWSYILRKFKAIGI